MLPLRDIEIPDREVSMNDKDPKSNADKLRAAWPVTAQTLRDLETLAADMPAGDAAVFVTDADLDSRNRLGATFSDEQCEALRNINIDALKNAPLVSAPPHHRSLPGWTPDRGEPISIAMPSEEAQRAMTDWVNQVIDQHVLKATAILVYRAEPPHRSPFTRAWDALRRFVAKLVRRP
jgi:hypothetical protein